MCTVLLPPDGYPVAVNKYIISCHITARSIRQINSSSASCPWKTATVTALSVQTQVRCRGQLKCDGTRAETRFLLSAKRTSPFKSAWASVQSTTGSRGVRISGNNTGYTMFRGSVKGTGYPLHSLVSPSLPFPCVTVCHHISTGVYIRLSRRRWNLSESRT